MHGTWLMARWLPTDGPCVLRVDRPPAKDRCAASVWVVDGQPPQMLRMASRRSPGLEPKWLWEIDRPSGPELWPLKESTPMSAPPKPT